MMRSLCAVLGYLAGTITHLTTQETIGSSCLAWGPVALSCLRTAVQSRGLGRSGSPSISLASQVDPEGASEFLYAKAARVVLMDLWSKVSRARSTVEHLLFRLITGRYSRKAGIGIGIVAAVLIAIVGYVTGPAVGRIVTASPLVPPLRFTTVELTVLWGVHATVITLSLVGLSFAWNSVRGLPTTDTIISEVAYRLRSIETIAFLLTANLCIGAGLLLATGDVVTANIVLLAWALLVASIGVTIHRFWIVFDLLLHNTLDEKVFDFADAALSGKSRSTASNYDEYLGHFFDESHNEIELDRPERLREKLRGVEDLLDELLSSDSLLKDEKGFWEYVYGKYDSVYRRTIVQQNPELEKEVIASLSGVFWKTHNHGDTARAVRTLQCFATLFTRGYSMEPQSSSAEFLLERFENAQIRILSQFQNADDAESLEEAKTLIEGILDTHTSLWRTAVENEAVGVLEYLRHMLDDPYQFRRYRYAPPQTLREAQDIPNDSIEAQKQESADTYREAIDRLKFAAYGWALNLFEEGDVSDYFIEQVFKGHVEADFGSVNKLSELYFEMGEATEPLNYWEHWNLDRALENSYGVASTGMAFNTWLLRFYCTSLVWVLNDQDTIDNLGQRDPNDSPLTEYKHVQNRVDRTIDRIDSSRDEYPLAEFVDSGPSIDDRCDALIDYFEEVKSLLDEQERNWIRTLPISDGSVDRLGESIDSQLDSCSLRTAFEEVGGITQVETLDRDANAEFRHFESAGRKGFVDDGIPTFFSSNFSGLIDQYRGLVLDHLAFEERRLDPDADILDALVDLISREDVALIVVEHTAVARILPDDERTERSSDSDLGSHFTLMEIPVLRDVTTEFAAVAFFDEGFEYVEEVDDYPIAVDVTAGENVDDWDSDEFSDEEGIKDYAQIEYSYNAHIESSGPNGVIFRISE